MVTGTITVGVTIVAVVTMVVASADEVVAVTEDDESGRDTDVVDEVEATIPPIVSEEVPDTELVEAIERADVVVRLEVRSEIEVVVLKPVALFDSKPDVTDTALEVVGTVTDNEALELDMLNVDAPRTDDTKPDVLVVTAVVESPVAPIMNPGGNDVTIIGIVTVWVCVCPGRVTGTI